MVGYVTQFKSRIMINVGVKAKNWKHRACKKYYIWNPAVCTCENREYLVSTIDNSVITCDEVIHAAGSVSTYVSTISNHQVSLCFNYKKSKANLWQKLKKQAN